MPATPKRMMGQQKREITPTQWPGFIKQYLADKAAAEAITKRVNDAKAAVTAYVKAYGDADEKGSLYVDVEGVEGVGSMKFERRVGQSFDKAKAEAWLKKNGKFDQYTKTIVVLDEDALAAAAYEGSIPERTYQGFFEDTETWALKTVK
jgi:uncharacterized protein with ACT and thioredoxin-like domain